MVAGGTQSLVPVSGPFGQTDLGLRTVTPDLAADRAAGITADGSALYVEPVRADVGAEPAKVKPVVEGVVDLLPPAWDFSGRLWIVDRRADGAAVRYLQPGADRVQEIDVTGISGADVKSFLVSRDGSRLVAVLRGEDEDTVVVSRLLQTEDGESAGALAARQVDVEEGRLLRIRDIAWLTPTSIVVLHPAGDDLFQVRTASVDGAPGEVDDLSVTLDGRVIGLLGSPDPRQSTYAVVVDEQVDQLVDLAGPTGSNPEVDPGVTSLGYVG